MVDDAVKRDRLWIVAEWMAKTVDEPKWNSAWIAVERMAMQVRHIKASRLVSYIAREFMPQAPTTIDNLVYEVDMWMTWRLKDRGGHALAKRRLNFWRMRLEHRLKASEPPMTHVEPEDPGKVLADYVRLATEGGLRLKFTKPAMGVLVALPTHGLKFALSGIIDLYEGGVATASTTLVTLGALKRQLRNMPL